MKFFTKITLTLITFVLLTQVVSAQTVNSGAWMIGGSAGFSSQKYKNDSKATSYLDLNPSLGYYIADDLAIGLGVDFNSVSFDGNSSSSFAVAPAVRYYVTNPIFLQVGANLGLNEGAGTSFGAAVGYSWFLNNSVAIEPALFFTSFGNDGDTFDGSVFGLSIGVQAFTGRN
jgi:hypothetical protein